MTTIDTHNDGNVGGRAIVRGPSLATRLGASWRVDIWPSIWGVALTIAVLLVAPFIVALILPVNIVTVDIMTSSIAETFTAGVLIAAIIAACSSSTGRREALLGGWTRRERVQVTVVLGVGAAIVAAAVWLLVAALRPDPRPVLALFGHGDLFEIMHPAPSALAALVVAAFALLGAFVPSLLVALARIHWVVVTLGSIVLALVVTMLGIAYGQVAYPMSVLPADVTAVADSTLMTVSLTAGFVGTALVVAASIALTLRTSVKRFR